MFDPCTHEKFFFPPSAKKAVPMCGYNWIAGKASSHVHLNCARRGGAPSMYTPFSWPFSPCTVLYTVRVSLSFKLRRCPIEQMTSKIHKKWFFVFCCKKYPPSSPFPSSKLVSYSTAAKNITSPENIFDPSTQGKNYSPPLRKKWCPCVSIMIEYLFIHTVFWQYVQTKIHI